MSDGSGPLLELSEQCHELTCVNKITWASGPRIAQRGERRTGRPARSHCRSLARGENRWGEGGSETEYNLKVEGTAPANISDRDARETGVSDCKLCSNRWEDASS